MRAIDIFYRAVQSSGRPRTTRRPDQSDQDYYLAELAAGSPDDLARRLAGLPPAASDNVDE